LRVAFVTVGDPGRPTGGYLYNARVLAGLRARGVEAEQIVASGASPEEQRSGAPRLGATLDPDAFDALVVDALARVAAAPHLDRWRASCPVVAMVHELPSVAGAAEGRTPDTLAREMEHEAPLLRADLLVAVSGHGRKVLEARGVPTGRIRVVPPGFDRLSPPPGAPPRRMPSGGVRALCVAQWIPRKGILDLVRTWTRAPRPNATLELIGETEADPAYARAVRAAAGSDPSVVVRGPVSDADLAAAYASSDLFVLPSRYEGYGIVYAEALRFGLPVIACDVGPVPDVMGRGTALLVPPGDERALADALDRLIGGRRLRERMSAAARRRAGLLPRWEDTVSGFHETLLAACRESVRGRS